MPSLGSGYFSSMYFTMLSESPILHGRLKRASTHGVQRYG